MELNYKTIIDVITPKKNIYTVFNSIITSEFTIYNSNFSLLKTIINCLKNDNEDEDKIKQNILNNLQNDYNNLNLKFKNKYSLEKVKELINNNNNNIYLHFICQYLKINVFIFNYKKNKIYSCYFGNYFNSLRETILFESDKGASVNLRMQMIADAIYYIDRAPILGHGLGSYGFVVYGTDFRAYPHNGFLEIWFEAGIVGLILFIAFIMMGLFAAMNRNYVVLACIIIFLTLNFLKSSSLDELRLLFLICGFSAGFVVKGEEHKN